MDRFAPRRRGSRSRSGLGFLRTRIRFLRRGQDGVKGCAFHAGHEFDQPGIADIENEAVDDFVAEVAMGHLAALESEGCFNLVAFAEKADGLIFLSLVVMFVDGDGELDLFDRDDFLLLAGCPFAFVLFVEEFAVVLNLADWRNGVGGDLYEVEGTFACHLEGIKRRHDAKLFAVFIDNADFSGADTFVGADKRLRGAFINWWNKSPPQRDFVPAMHCSGI